MFSPNNSANPLPQLPSSFHLSPPFIGHNGHDILLHHHHDLLLGHLLPANAPVVETVSSMAGSNKATMSTNQEINGLTGDDHYDSSPKKKPVKKDRHSKIYTSQGPRDRRVRLSIGIARKFFDLQDMLGFDKASKTLDWLFIKSKTAINELEAEQMKRSCSGGSKSLSSASECEVVSGTNEVADNGDPSGIVSKRNPLTSDKRLYTAAFHLLARESRAKARARARERTREKMCTRKQNELKKLRDSSPSTLNHYRSLSQIQSSEELRSHSHITVSSINQAPKEDIIEESIVIRRKLKPSSIFDYQQDLSKETNFNNNNNNSPNIPQHWDISNTITHSSFCAMSNMNLSTEFQTYDKPWEVYNSHSQR